MNYLPTIEVMKAANPVMPVLAIENVEDAIPLAKALVAGGIKVLEVTLRTAAAMEVIKAMKTVEGAIVGAGTVSTPQQLDELQAIGCDFAISPGATDALLKHGKKIDMPYLPAVSTVSEVMKAAEYGYNEFKLFPASIVGGAGLLKAISGPFPHFRFCPTGGISSADFTDYLAMKNVECVGGSWIVPADALQAKDWAKIEQLARETVAKAKG